MDRTPNTEHRTPNLNTKMEKEKILEIRKQLGLTQVEFGAKLDVFPSHVSKWEHGNVKISRKNADKVLGLLKQDEMVDKYESDIEQITRTMGDLKRVYLKNELNLARLETKVESSICIKELKKEVKKVLLEKEKALAEFQDFKIETNDEFIFVGWVEALNFILTLIHIQRLKNERH